MGAYDTGKTQLQAILAKLPESMRGPVAEAFGKDEAKDALTLLGDTTLARSDYSRAMDEVAQKEQQVLSDFNRLNTWYQTVKPKVENYDTLEAEVNRLKLTPAPAPITQEVKSGLTREQLEEWANNRDQGYAGVLALTTTIATKHLKEFGEVLDVQDVMQLAANKHISLQDAYNEKYGQQLKDKADAVEKARIDKLLEEARADERKKFQGLPYPIRNASPSVLDVLDSTTDKPSNHTLDSAVAEYERLAANRG